MPESRLLQWFGDENFVITMIHEIGDIPGSEPNGTYLSGEVQTQSDTMLNRAERSEA